MQKRYSKTELCFIWLDSFLGLEYRHKAELFNLIKDKSDIKSLIENAKDYIVRNVGENEYNTLLHSANDNYLKSVLEGLSKKEIIAITRESEDYPEELYNLPLSPLVLYAKGDISLLKTEKFAIVGSRRNIPLSIKIAEDYAKELSDAGFTIVTGIAEGIDKTVIETVLKNKGKIISVIAGGFDNVYPKSHINLFNSVTENGLAITESPPEIAPLPFFFPIRNRIIAGLGNGTLIVSGGKKSGTMYTAEYAEEYGKDLFVVPYSIGVFCGEGNNELIKRGAILTDTPKDILEFYSKEIKNTKKIIFTEQEKALIDALKDSDGKVEKLCKKLGKKIFEITPVLSMLEIKGAIVRNGVNEYAISIDLED